MSFGATNGVAERITKAGEYKLTTASRGVAYQKSKFVIVPLINDNNEEYTVSAGVTSKGEPYDTLSITARTLNICTPELSKVNEAKTKGSNNLESLLVKLAHAVAKHFSKPQPVKLAIAKKNGKVVKGIDGKPRLNIV